MLMSGERIDRVGQPEEAEGRFAEAAEGQKSLPSLVARSFDRCLVWRLVLQLIVARSGE